MRDLTDERFWIDKRSADDDGAGVLDGWHAVVDDETGIVAYFGNKNDARAFLALLRWRMIAREIESEDD